ncbi:MAG: hypothetical protein R2932_54705 [Caldilineaceae bacterium]
MTKFAPLNLTPANLLDYTPDWTGDRAADGRHLLPLPRFSTDAPASPLPRRGAFCGDGYHHQYEDGWLATTGQSACRAALTAMYMPRRPEMRTVMEAKGAELGCIGDQISWPIDIAVPGDVYIADVYGKIDQSAVIGDNLATSISIYAKSGNGIVHDAAVLTSTAFRSYRLHQLCAQLPPHLCVADDYVNRRQHPIRIGKATVMPEILVLGRARMA